MAERERRPRRTPLFLPNDDPARKIFEDHPSAAVVEEFLAFVKETGKPHEFRYHLHTKPARTLDPVLVRPFSIPLKFRGDGQEAPCPVCRLGFPKYYSGVLVWFPAEKALRAIGEECGHEYFREGVYAAAQQDYARKQEDQRNLDFLVDNLPQVLAAKTLLSSMIERARKLDQVRTNIRRALGQKNANRIAREGANGVLKVQDVRYVDVIGRDGTPVLDEDGNVKKKPMSFDVASYRFSGAQVFGDLRLAEAILFRAQRALDAVDFAGDDDAILEAFQRWGRSGMHEAEKRLREGWALLAEVNELFQETRTLLTRPNIASLDKWMSHVRTPVKARVSFGAVGTLDFHQWGSAAVRISMPISGFFDIEMPPKLKE